MAVGPEEYVADRRRDPRVPARRRAVPAPHRVRALRPHGRRAHSPWPPSTTPEPTGFRRPWHPTSSATCSCSTTRTSGPTSSWAPPVTAPTSSSTSPTSSTRSARRWRSSGEPSPRPARTTRSGWKFFASVDGASGYAAGTGYVERFTRLNSQKVPYLPLAELRAPCPAELVHEGVLFRNPEPGPPRALRVSAQRRAAVRGRAPLLLPPRPGVLFAGRSHRPAAIDGRRPDMDRRDGLVRDPRATRSPTRTRPRTGRASGTGPSLVLAQRHRAERLRGAPVQRRDRRDEGRRIPSCSGRPTADAPGRRPRAVDLGQPGCRSTRRRRSSSFPTGAGSSGARSGRPGTTPRRCTSRGFGLFSTRPGPDVGRAGRFPECRGPRAHVLAQPLHADARRRRRRAPVDAERRWRRELRPAPRHVRSLRDAVEPSRGPPGSRPRRAGSPISAGSGWPRPTRFAPG